MVQGNMEYHPSAEDLNKYVADTLDDLTAQLVESHVAKCTKCAETLGGVVRTVLDAHLAKLEEGQRRVDALRRKVNKALGRHIN